MPIKFTYLSLLNENIILKGWSGTCFILLCIICHNCAQSIKVEERQICVKLSGCWRTMPFSNCVPFVLLLLCLLVRHFLCSGLDEDLIYIFHQTFHQSNMVRKRERPIVIRTTKGGSDGSRDGYKDQCQFKSLFE